VSGDKAPQRPSARTTMRSPVRFDPNLVEEPGT
jgi:hypothetical protein